MFVKWSHYFPIVPTDCIIAMLVQYLTRPPRQIVRQSRRASGLKNLSPGPGVTIPCLCSAINHSLVLNFPPDFCDFCEFTTLDLIKAFDLTTLKTYFETNHTCSLSGHVVSALLYF